MTNKNEILNINEDDNELLELEDFDLDSLEEKLEQEIMSDLEELELLDEERNNISNPEGLGKVVENVILEQVSNQLGVDIGNEFIKNNNNLQLDLRKSAHIQTTENFAKGKIATHNTEINYQQRYDDWNSNFKKDDKGNIITHTTRSGKEEATLVKGARKPYDKGRPTGSKEKGTDMDHVISNGEMARDPALAAHTTQEQRVNFANSDTNLNEIRSPVNRAKGDTSTEDFLNNPNSKGQYAKDVHNITEQEEKQMREKDKQAREEYEKLKEKGEKRSIEAGKKSRKKEAKRIGKAALKAAALGMLQSFMKEVIKDLVTWIKSSSKSLKSLFKSIKASIVRFTSNLREHAEDSGKTMFTTIATALWKPFMKVWSLVKQGWKSLKEAYQYLKNPENKNKPFSEKVAEVGKIVIAGLTAVSAIGLSAVIEVEITKGFPKLEGIEIPLLGSLPSLIGIFAGGVIAGIIGGLAINLIDRFTRKKRIDTLDTTRLEKGNLIISNQQQLQAVVGEKVAQKRNEVFEDMHERHEQVKEYIIEKNIEFEEKRESMEKMRANMKESREEITKLGENIKKSRDKNRKKLDEMDSLINSLLED